MMITEFFSALLLTVIIESIVAFIMRYRGKFFYLVLILVNIITNPAINFILLLVYQLGIYKLYIIAQVTLEIFVVIVEWKILKYAFPEEKKSLLLLSFSMNSASYIFGSLILKLL